MHILIFGTFDEAKHPRVRVLREGLTEQVERVSVCNVPLGFGTAQRVSVATRPWRGPLLLWHLASCWCRLSWRSRIYHPDVVVVGYLGHFDVHLARLRYPKALLVLDHLVSLEATVRDRAPGRSGALTSALGVVDRLALRSADVVLVDTEEQRELVPEAAREKSVVVPVGATGDWATSRRPLGESTGSDIGPPGSSQTMTVVFYGLYIPLHGTSVIAEAITMLWDAPIRWTMIGTGQDHDAARKVVADNPNVTWTDWLEESELQRTVARHDVCLGIFGTTPKASKVVPNKIYQGAMAGCAIVTSDTTPQRRIFGSSAVFVPPGDPAALATTLRTLAADPGRLQIMRARAGDLASRRFTPIAVTEPLVRKLEKLTCP